MANHPGNGICTDSLARFVDILMPDRSHHEIKRLKTAFSLFPETDAVKKTK
jgi:hypothetical protein